MTASKKAYGAIAIILLILLIDQIIKIWVKTHLKLPYPCSECPNADLNDLVITNWFRIRFIENPGMAMGIDVFGKLFLTVFRIVASIAIAYYIYLLIRNKFHFGYIILISMIFAGAVGNIIDSVFYGVIFSGSTYEHVATLFPPEGGYGSWLHGEVVDMFYFKLFHFRWPSWIPWIGGSNFEFFRYIFNFADASISVGIIVLLLFFRKTLSLSFEKQEVES
jgi:signal peptidase II